MESKKEDKRRSRLFYFLSVWLPAIVFWALPPPRDIIYRINAIEFNETRLSPILPIILVTTLGLIALSIFTVWGAKKWYKDETLSGGIFLMIFQYFVVVIFGALVYFLPQLVIAGIGWLFF